VSERPRFQADLSAIRDSSFDGRGLGRSPPPNPSPLAFVPDWGLRTPLAGLREHGKKGRRAMKDVRIEPGVPVGEGKSIDTVQVHPL